MTMESMIATLPTQYRWASELTIPEIPEAKSIVVCGMGGSGIGGDVVAAIAEGPVFVNKDYGLPGWVEALPTPLVVAVSYSGNTEETLSAVEAAHDWGVPVVVVSSGGLLSDQAASEGWPLVTVPGGLQPRAAFGYLGGAVLRLVERAGLLSETGLSEAATVTGELLGTDLDGPGRHLADDLADGLAGKLTVIAAAGITSVAAYRWKTQINENAKSPAFVTRLPEGDHNEIEGWSTLPMIRTVGVVLLRDPSERPRVAARFGPTARLVSEGATVVGEVWAQGSSPFARIASLAVVGDLVSLRLARNAGIDPIEVEAIERFKKTLGEP
jgi:glucose/mannose-6-phosphate isomerase